MKVVGLDGNATKEIRQKLSLSHTRYTIKKYNHASFSWWNRCERGRWACGGEWAAGVSLVLSSERSAAGKLSRVQENDVGEQFYESPMPISNDRLVNRCQAK
jgi:hypothetical protein